LLAYGQALGRCAALDPRLDREQLGDALQRLLGQWRRRGFIDVVELAAGVRPARDLGEPHRASVRIGRKQGVEPGIAVGMQEAAAVAEQRLGMLAFAIGRVAVEGRRRRGSRERPLVAHRRP